MPAFLSSPRACLQLEKANRQLADLKQHQAQAEAERAGLIERAVQANALAEGLQKQVLQLLRQ